MVLRTYPTALTADPALITAAAAEGVPIGQAAKFVGGLKPEHLAGLKAHILKAEAYALDAAGWKDAFSPLANLTDAQVRTLMRWLAATTPPAVAVDDGVP